MTQSLVEAESSGSDSLCFTKVTFTSSSSSYLTCPVEVLTLPSHTVRPWLCTFPNHTPSLTTHLHWSHTLQTGKEEVKASVLADDMKLYISDPKTSTGKLGQLLHTSSKGSVQSLLIKTSSPPIHK